MQALTTATNRIMSQSIAVIRNVNPTQAPLEPYLTNHNIRVRRAAHLPMDPSGGIYKGQSHGKKGEIIVGCCSHKE